MRKKISILLVMVMVLSMIPMNVLAASTSSVSRVPVVKVNHIFHAGNDAPVLRIQEYAPGEFNVPLLEPEVDEGVDVGVREFNVATGAVEIGESFRLSLKNARFVFESKQGVSTSILTASETPGIRSAYTYKITRLSDNEVIVELTGVTSHYSATAKNVIEIPLFVETRNVGWAEVSVNGRDSAISSDSRRFAEVSSRKTSVRISDSVPHISFSSGQRGAPILIEEVIVEALSKTDVNNTRDKHGFQLRLANGFRWEDGTRVDFRGISESNVTINISDNGRDLTVHFDVQAPTTGRGAITVTPHINVTRDARYGDVTVAMTGHGDIESGSGLVIAKYLAYGASIKVANLADNQFYAGRLLNNLGNLYELEFTVESNVKNSFVPNRNIDFSFQKWMRIIDVELLNDAKGAEDRVRMELLGGNSFSYRVLQNDEKLTFKVLFTVDAKAVEDGPVDLVMNVAGAGVEETDVKVGVVRPVVEVSVSSQEKAVVSGLLKQVTPTITLVETGAGALLENGRVAVSFEATHGGGIRFDSFDIKVTKGDLEIANSRVSKDGGSIEFEVSGDSSTASTIEISNILTSTNRVIPKGDYYVVVGGSALVNNTSDSMGRADHAFSGVNQRGNLEEILRRARFGEYAVKVFYVSVDTPIGNEAPAETGRVAKMTVGESSYTIDGQVKEMDVAPYIQNGRIMVPVRHVAEAIGINRNSIVWYAAERRVTIMADKIIQLQIGSYSMVVNGANIQMDAEAEIVNGRTFVPLSRIALALGVDYTWDAQAKTVTFTP